MKIWRCDPTGPDALQCWELPHTMLGHVISERVAAGPKGELITWVATIPEPSAVAIGVVALLVLLCVITTQSQKRR